MIRNRAGRLESRNGPIAVARYGATGASARVRLHDWFAHCGIRPEYWDYLGGSNNRLRTLLRQAPQVAKEEFRLRRSTPMVAGRTLVLSRGASPFSSGALEHDLLVRAGHAVYDFDDAIFAASPSRLSRRLWSENKVWDRCLEAADIVIAGSEFLAEVASSVRRDVVMIPSCVEPESYVRKRDYDISGSPRAVWIGSPSTEQFLINIADDLLLLNRRSGMRLKVISSGNRSLGALDTIVDRVDWSASSFSREIADADFGLMPLPDTEFERGKCAYKLLQYGACGLPLAGSPVGANVQALARLQGVSVVASRHAWVDAITSLLEASPKTRAELGGAGREGVEQHYSYAQWAPTWLKATGLIAGETYASGDETQCVE